MDNRLNQFNKFFLGGWSVGNRSTGSSRLLVTGFAFGIFGAILWFVRALVLHMGLEDGFRSNLGHFSGWLQPTLNPCGFLAGKELWSYEGQLPTSGKGELNELGFRGWRWGIPDMNVEENEVVWMLMGEGEKRRRENGIRLERKKKGFLRNPG